MPERLKQKIKGLLCAMGFHRTEWEEEFAGPFGSRLLTGHCEWCGEAQARIEN